MQQMISKIKTKLYQKSRRHSFCYVLWDTLYLSLHSDSHSHIGIKLIFHVHRRVIYFGGFYGYFNIFQECS